VRPEALRVCLVLVTRRQLRALTLPVGPGIVAERTARSVREGCEHVFAMAYPAYVREKARQLRIERRLSIVEIAERLALPKTTVFYWVRDIPLGRPRRENPHPGTRAMQRKFRLLREQAYKDGLESFPVLVAEPTFRDFVCMYIGEGHKRNPTRVSIANSDPRVVVLATRWLRKLSRNKLLFSVQYHADQDLRKLSEFWATTLGIEPRDVRMQRKSNSGRLGGRTWRCRYGVLTVTTGDTLLRAQLQAWMDCVQEQWIHSPANGA
jgi:transposase-like protein